MSILTLSILGIVGIIILFIGIALDSYEYENLKIALIIIGIVGLLIIGVGGFGMHAVNNFKTMTVEKIRPDTVLKSKYKVYVEFGDTTYTYTEKRDYEEINDSTKYYKVNYYNYYGFECAELLTRNSKFANVEEGKEVEPIEIEE